jgi:hypothetical protein
MGRTDKERTITDEEMTQLAINTELQRKFGFEPDHVVAVAKKSLVKIQRSPGSPAT